MKNASAYLWLTRTLDDYIGSDPLHQALPWTSLDFVSFEACLIHVSGTMSQTRLLESPSLLASCAAAVPLIAKVSLKCFTDFSHRFVLLGAVTNLSPGLS